MSFFVYCQLDIFLESMLEYSRLAVTTDLLKFHHCVILGHFNFRVFMPAVETNIDIG